MFSMFHYLGLNVYIHNLGSQIKRLFGVSHHQDSNKTLSSYATGKDCIMHGFIYKLGGPFNTQWQRKYFYLFPNRIESINENESYYVPCMTTSSIRSDNNNSLSCAGSSNTSKNQFSAEGASINSNAINSNGSMTAIEKIAAIDTVRYRSYKCLQIKFKNSGKDIFLRFETEPEFLQWRKELTACFTKVSLLNKKGPKLMQIQSSRSVLDDVTFNRAVALAKGDINKNSYKK